MTIEIASRGVLIADGLLNLASFSMRNPSDVVSGKGNWRRSQSPQVACQITHFVYCKVSNSAWPVAHDAFHLHSGSTVTESVLCYMFD